MFGTSTCLTEKKYLMILSYDFSLRCNRSRVIASAAKQSRGFVRCSGDCRVASLRFAPRNDGLHKRLCVGCEQLSIPALHHCDFYFMVEWRRGYRVKIAEIAQLAERIHGKDEVPGSIPGLGL